MRKGSRRKPKYADQTPLITNQADVPVGYVPASASMPLSRTAEMHRRLRAEKKARIEARFDRLESMISEIKEMLREQAAAVGNIQAAMELRLESSSSGLE